MHLSKYLGFETAYVREVLIVCKICKNANNETVSCDCREPK